MTKYNYIRKTFTFEGRRYEVRGATLEEAIENMVIAKQKLQAGQVLISSSMLVNDWFYKAVGIYKSEAGDAWLYNFTNITKNHVLSEIGHMKLKDVKPLYCQQILNAVSGRSESLIEKVYQGLDFIFATAFDNGLISINPMKKVKRPKGYSNQRRSLTPFERKIFLQVAETHRAGPWLKSMLYCGLRPSETAMIKGKDIRIIDGEKYLFVDGTKSAAAKRYIPLPDELYEVLPPVSPFEYVFSTPTGRQLNKTYMRRMWLSFKRDMNIAAGCRMYRNALVPPYPIAPELSPYYLRHTYCTDLQNAGVDIRVAQKFMGHSKIEMTYKIYSHNDSLAMSTAGEQISSHIKKINSDCLSG
ncbi:MAG: tyrosine-type recombinase/integrase [Emergencia sp.]|nr:tyrosine-type recombinase/integrase [Emergencia sp.]